MPVRLSPNSSYGLLDQSSRTVCEYFDCIPHVIVHPGAVVRSGGKGIDPKLYLSIDIHGVIVVDWNLINVS
jgi:hypothetical protein